MTSAYRADWIREVAATGLRRLAAVAPNRKYE